MFKSITGKEDWKELPEASIADILTNLQGSLAVNWDGNKFTVPALGVSGLMEQNGYINLGKLFGGLIVQWGKDTSPGRHATRQYMLPLAVSINLVVMLTVANASLGASDSDPGDVAGDFAVTVKDSTSFTVYQNYIQLSNLMWLAIGFCRPSCVTTNT